MNGAGEYELRDLLHMWLSCLPSDLVSSNWEQLMCMQETGNPTDHYAVVVIKDSTIIGHLPKKISDIFLGGLEVEALNTNYRGQSEERK